MNMLNSMTNSIDSTTVLNPVATSIDSTTALKWATQFWYLVTALGMWLFVYYIVAFYYAPTLSGDFEAWNAHHILTHPYIPGDTGGNLMFAAHVLLAGVLTLGGTIQLVPQLRRHALALHRWNGRVFMVAALLAAIGGLGLNILRGIDEDGGGWPSAIDFNGLLILIFATLGWIYARRGQIAAHRQWALRTFMVVSGVWFLRLGVSIWILGTATIYGQPQSVGDFFSVWTWGSFLFPLAVLQVYLWSQKRGSATARYIVAAVLVVLTLLTAVGIFGAYKVFWSPLL